MIRLLPPCRGSPARSSNEWPLSRRKLLTTSRCQAGGGVQGRGGRSKRGVGSGTGGTRLVHHCAAKVLLDGGDEARLVALGGHGERVVTHVAHQRAEREQRQIDHGGGASPTLTAVLGIRGPLSVQVEIKLVLGGGEEASGQAHASYHAVRVRVRLCGWPQSAHCAPHANMDGRGQWGDGRTVWAAGSCGGESSYLGLLLLGGEAARALHRAGQARDGRLRGSRQTRLLGLRNQHLPLSVTRLPPLHGGKCLQHGAAQHLINRHLRPPCL